MGNLAKRSVSSICAALALAACAAEPAPPRKLDWGTGTSVLPHPPSTSGNRDGPPLSADAGGAERPGRCVDDTSCGAYACELATGTCRNQCLTATHCAKGHACDLLNAVCALVSPCSDDSSCGGYRCDLAAKVCELSCSLSQTCAPGYLCEPDGRCAP